MEWNIKDTILAICDILYILTSQCQICSIKVYSDQINIVIFLLYKTENNLGTKIMQ